MGRDLFLVICGVSVTRRDQPAHFADLHTGDMADPDYEFSDAGRGNTPHGFAVIVATLACVPLVLSVAIISFLNWLFL
jgi:hypothetical protein